MTDTNWSGRPEGVISCPSPAGCYTTAVAWLTQPEGHLGVPGITPLSPDGVPGPIQALSDRSGNAFGISCVAEGVCTVVGNDNWAAEGLVIDVRPASPPVATLWPDTNWFGGVSCLTATTCGFTGVRAGIPQVRVFGWRS